MVTTIKITCDGVFIQSNQYLTNSNSSELHLQQHRYNDDRFSLQEISSSGSFYQMDNSHTIMSSNTINNNMEDKTNNFDKENHLIKFSEFSSNLPLPALTTKGKVSRSASCLTHKEFLVRSRSKKLSTHNRLKNFLTQKINFNNNTSVKCNNNEKYHDQQYSHNNNHQHHRHHHHHQHTTNDSRLLGIFFGTNRKCSKSQKTSQFQEKFFTSRSRHRNHNDNQHNINNCVENFSTISTARRLKKLSNSDQKQVQLQQHKQTNQQQSVAYDNSLQSSQLTEVSQSDHNRKNKSSLTSFGASIFKKSLTFCDSSAPSSLTNIMTNNSNETNNNALSLPPIMPVGSLKTRFLQRSHSTNAPCVKDHTNNFSFSNGTFNVGHLNEIIKKPIGCLIQSTENFDVNLRNKTTIQKSLRCKPALAVSSDSLTYRKSASVRDLQESKNIINNIFEEYTIDLKLLNRNNTKIEVSGETILLFEKQKQQKHSNLKVGGSMNSHATATQALNLQSSAGQSSVVGHHRGFSQPSGGGAVNTAGDPWFLQSTGHQMPPTAPARHNKRPAPQPGTVVGIGLSSGGVVGGIGNSLLQQQQQHSQSQPHIVPPTIPPHQTNLNQQHINPIHLSSHALNSHNLLSSNHTPKSPNQHLTSVQQLIIPPIHNLATSSISTCQGQLMTNSSNSNIMSSSLNTAQLQGHISSVSGKIHLNSVAGSSAGLIVHPIQQQHQSQPSSLPSNQCPSSINVPIASNVMSTSLHNFDANGTAWNSASSLSPTISNASSTSSTNHQMQQAQHVQQGIHSQQHLQQQMPHRKCEVKLNAMPWFHGSISRDEAEHLLQPRDDGLFLVRESTNFPGDYTLCVCYQGKVEHYRVKYLENKLTIDDEEYFENLGQLVAHYEKDADGLCTQLIKCLPKKGKQEYCINSKDFADKGWVIPESDLQLRESIGKGEFGDVMLGILRNDRVAVKMLKDDGAAQKFLAEASVMTTLEHENLVKFIGLVFTSKHIYLVTEYMSKGSLVDYLRSRGRQHITKKDQINFAFDTCSGMEYLEAKKVVHRDLAARNVLISENCTAKVSDFGLAREECYNLEVGKLPIKWTAPEALKGGRFSNKSDMWSFGILLWEIYSFGRVPYPRIPLADVVKHVEVGYKMEAPEGCPTEIYDMMRQAWDLNPIKRPTFSELKVKLLQLKNTTT